MTNLDPTVPSPCVNNCCLDQDDICLGCFRSIDEILKWSNASNDQRYEIINLANQRHLEHQEKYKF